MAVNVIPVQPFDLVVFGGTGDLSRRKLVPALYRRVAVGQAPRTARIILTGRSDLTADDFRSQARVWLQEAGVKEASKGGGLSFDKYIGMLRYVKVDAREQTGWSTLNEILAETDHVRLFYMAVQPDIVAAIVDRIHEHDCFDQKSRIIMEKPIGHDRQSAREVTETVARRIPERQIYRIDHYLGKETVQNLMVLRFANPLFEPLWRAEHVDNVQITVAESIGVEGRTAYYDHSGAVRDMLQNHLMQLLCLVAMEPPANFDAEAVRDEKVKVLRALVPVSRDDVAFGQYSASHRGNEYHQDVGNPDSKTESFVAVRAKIANWRWSGVPFYLRTGKRLSDRVSEIAVEFKPPPHQIFDPSAGPMARNVLSIRLQPDEGITLRLTIKDPGPGGLRMREVPLDMSFAQAFLGDNSSFPDAYERLIMDVVRGDQTLFMRDDEVDAAWGWIDHLRSTMAEANTTPSAYDSNSMGPVDAMMLAHSDGRRWRTADEMTAQRDG